MTTHESEYCTVAEAAQLLHVSAPTVWRWVDSGRLEAFRVGTRAIRIRRGDLDAVLAAARPQAVGLQMERYTIHVGDRKADPSELIRELEDAQRRLLARRGGKVLTPSAVLIREAREERAASL